MLETATGNDRRSHELKAKIRGARISLASARAAFGRPPKTMTTMMMVMMMTMMMVLIMMMVAPQVRVNEDGSESRMDIRENLLVF